MYKQIILIVIVAAAAYFLKGFLDKKEQKPGRSDNDYMNSYKQKWLFSYNEKEAFKRLRAITDEHGYTLLSKVRLYDLIEPKTGIKNSKGAVWKIQAKHVDFVICDSSLVARWVIELDDSSHERKDRAERDIFVDTVLTNCGYKIQHTKCVMPSEIESFIST